MPRPRKTDSVAAAPNAATAPVTDTVTDTDAISDAISDAIADINGRLDDIVAYIRERDQLPRGNPWGF